MNDPMESEYGSMAVAKNLKLDPKSEPPPADWWLSARVGLENRRRWSDDKLAEFLRPLWMGRAPVPVEAANLLAKAQRMPLGEPFRSKSAVILGPGFGWIFFHESGAFGTAFLDAEKALTAATLAKARSLSDHMGRFFMDDDGGAMTCAQCLIRRPFARICGLAFADTDAGVSPLAWCLGCQMTTAGNVRGRDGQREFVESLRARWATLADRAAALPWWPGRDETEIRLATFAADAPEWADDAGRHPENGQMVIATSAARAFADWRVDRGEMDLEQARRQYAMTFKIDAEGSGT